MGRQSSPPSSHRHAAAKLPLPFLFPLRPVRNSTGEGTRPPAPTSSTDSIPAPPAGKAAICTNACTLGSQPPGTVCSLTPRVFRRQRHRGCQGKCGERAPPHSGFLQSKNVAQCRWNRRCLQLIDSLLRKIFLKSVFCFVSLFASPYKNRTLRIYKSIAPWLHAHDRGRKSPRLSLCFIKPLLPVLRVPWPQESM